MTTRADQYGPVRVPPTATVAVAGSLVSALDPALTNLLSSFKTVLRAKLDTAWAKAASQFSSNVVEGTYAYEPLTQLAKLSWSWPALFLHRQSERLFNRTQTYRCAETTGRLLYVLPPLPYAQAVRLEPVRVAVRTVLDAFIAQYGDPSVSSGASPIYAGNSLESFEFTAASYGWLEGDMGQPHPMLEMAFTMRERMSFVASNASALTWIVTTLAVATEAGTATATTTSSTSLVVLNYNAVTGKVTTAGSPP